MATLPPLLEDGAEPELKPPEVPVEVEEPEELVPEPDPDCDAAPEPDVAEPDCDAAEPDCDVAVPAEVDALAVCVEPGSRAARAPAATTLPMATVVVAERTLARPRSLAATAWPTVYRCELFMHPILRSGIARALDEASAFVLRSCRAVLPGRLPTREG
ncbi:MAG: hypothetical protein JO132_06530 [Streptosporangiaceae bacterium]|nr:hypothetical protein [Streptosporangiaceae bacterium]